MAILSLPPRAAAALLAGILALGALAGCNEDGIGDPAPDPPVACAALNDSLFPDSQKTGIATFRVVQPNGGAFKVGSRMKVVVAGADYTSALVDLVVYGPAGGVARVPGHPKANGIDLSKQCEFAFAVPESVTTLFGKRISLVADSVKVRVSDYNDAVSLDYSDAFFSVIR